MRQRYRERPEYYERPRYRKQHSPLRGFLNFLIVLACIGILAFIGYIYIMYKQYLSLVVTILAIVLGAIGAILVLSFLFTVVSSAWSKVSEKTTQIKLNRLEVKERKRQLQEKYPDQERPPVLETRAYAQTANLQRGQFLVKTPSLENQMEPQRQSYREPQIEPQRAGYEHRKIEPVYYETIEPQIEQGSILMGIRQNGSIRSGTWDDNKSILILGNSSSGKTTTAIEKTISAVLSGALIVSCDPHAHKKDSLTRRLYPLNDFLYPGTKFGVTHEEIYHNVQIVLQELNARVNGSPSVVKLVLVVDEYNRLMRDETIAKELARIVEVIGQEGRGYNVYGIFLCQQITGNALLRKSVNSYIVHRIDESESKLVIPARFAKYTPELPTGLAFLKDADGMIEQLQQTIVTGDYIQAVADTYREEVLAYKAKMLRPRVTKDLRKTGNPGQRERTTRDLRGLQPGVSNQIQHYQGSTWGPVDVPPARIEPGYVEPAYRETPPAMQRPPQRQPQVRPPERPHNNRPVPSQDTFRPPERGYLPSQDTPLPPQEGFLTLQEPEEPERPPVKRQVHINLPEELKEQIINMARAGNSRRTIRAATGLTGAKYKLLQELLDSEGL